MTAGPISRRVSANVAKLRRARKMSLTELEQRTADAGCRIPVLGLRRLEQGKRRITLDEVEALATALGATFEQLAFNDLSVELVVSTETPTDRR